MNIHFRIPEIETARLRLRLPRATDLTAYTAFRASERARSVGGPFTAEQSFEHLAAIVGQWQLRGYGRWLVADRATDDPLGVVGIYHPADWPEAEIGWTVFDAAEGRGVAYEAALATRTFAFDTLGWTRIVSLVDPANARSVRLARRMGAVREGAFDHPRYGRLDIWRHAAPEIALVEGAAHDR